MPDKDQVKLLMQQLEESLISVDWREFTTTVKTSVEIFRAVLRIFESFPSLELANDTVQENINCISKNNIQHINNILVFCASSLAKSDVQSIRIKLKEYVPELKTEEHLETQDLEVNNECEENILCNLRAIIGIMNSILELLKCFKAAFFMCKQDSTGFSIQEFMSVSTGLKEIITMLESKAVSHTSGNRFLAVLSNSLSRLLKIMFRALWLLVTFPAIECVKFDVTFALCKSAICVFVCASDALIDLTRFLLKDFAMLCGVQDELLQNFQVVCNYCSRMLEEEPTVSVLEELGIESHSNVSSEMTCPSKLAVDVESPEKGEIIMRPEKMCAKADTVSNMQGAESNHDAVSSDAKPEISTSRKVGHNQSSDGVKRKFDCVTQNTAHTLEEIAPKVAKRTSQTLAAHEESIALDHEHITTQVFLPKPAGKTKEMYTSGPKIAVNAKNIHSKSVNVLKKMQRTSAQSAKSTADLKETQSTSVPKPVANVKGTLRASVSKEEVNLKEPQETSVSKSATSCFTKPTQTSLPKSTAQMKKIFSKSVDVPKEIKEPPATKPATKVKEMSLKSVNNFLRRTRKNSVQKPIVMSRNFCKVNVNTAKVVEAKTTSKLKSTMAFNDLKHTSADIEEESRRSSALKPTVNMNTTAVSQSCGAQSSIAAVSDETLTPSAVDSKSEQCSNINSSTKTSVGKSKAASINLTSSSSGPAPLFRNISDPKRFDSVAGPGRVWARERRHTVQSGSTRNIHANVSPYRKVNPIERDVTCEDFSGGKLPVEIDRAKTATLLGAEDIPPEFSLHTKTNPAKSIFNQVYVCTKRNPGEIFSKLFRPRKMRVPIQRRETLSFWETRSNHSGVVPYMKRKIDTLSINSGRQSSVGNWKRFDYGMEKGARKNTLISNVPILAKNTSDTFVQNTVHDTLNTIAPTPAQNAVFVQNNVNTKSVALNFSQRFVQDTSQILLNSLQNTDLRTTPSLSENLVHSTFPNTWEVLAHKSPEIVAQCTSEVLAQTTSKVLAQNPPKTVTQCMSEVLTQTTSEGLAENSPETVTQCMSEVLTQTTSEGLAENSPEIVTQCMPEVFTQTTSEALAQSSPETVTQCSSEVLTQAFLEVLAQSSSETIKQCTSEVLTQATLEILAQSSPRTVRQYTSEVLTLSTVQSFAETLAETVAQTTPQNLAENSVQSPSTAVAPEQINFQISSNELWIQSDVAWLTLRDQQPVRDVAARIGSQINDFMLTTKPGSYQLRMVCKLCRRPFKLKSVVNHLLEQKHQRLVAQRQY